MYDWAKPENAVCQGNDATGSGNIFVLPADSPRQCTVMTFISDNSERRESFAMSSWELKRFISALVKCL